MSGTCAIWVYWSPPVHEHRIELILIRINRRYATTLFYRVEDSLLLSVHVLLVTLIIRDAVLWCVVNIVRKLSENSVYILDVDGFLFLLLHRFALLYADFNAPDIKSFPELVHGELQPEDHGLNSFRPVEQWLRHIEQPSWWPKMLKALSCRPRTAQRGTRGDLWVTPECILVWKDKGTPGKRLYLGKSGWTGKRRWGPLSEIPW